MRRKKRKAEEIIPSVLAKLVLAFEQGKALQVGNTYVETNGRVFRRKVVESEIQLQNMTQLHKLQLLSLVKEQKVKLVTNRWDTLKTFEQKRKALDTWAMYTIRYRTDIELGNINTLRENA